MENGLLMREIVLAFLDITSDALEDNWLNKAAANIVAPNCNRTRNGKKCPNVHTEIWFRDTASDGYSCSICFNARVHWHKKTFSRAWTFRSLFCTDEAYAKIKSWCMLQRGCKFNSVGFFGMGLGLRISGSWTTWFGFKRRFFCSELVTAALKHGGILGPKQNTVIHPEELFLLIQSISSVTTIKDRNFTKIHY